MTVLSYSTLTDACALPWDVSFALVNPVCAQSGHEVPAARLGLLKHTECVFVGSEIPESGNRGWDFPILRVNLFDFFYKHTGAWSGPYNFPTPNARNDWENDCHRLGWIRWEYGTLTDNISAPL
jgi:hypothetical protein